MHLRIMTGYTFFCTKYLINNEIIDLSCRELDLMQQHDRLLLLKFIKTSKKKISNKDVTLNLKAGSFDSIREHI